MNKHLSVGEISNYINNHIDILAAEYIWISGEIQNFRDSSKHKYFTLNDEQISIKAIIWQSIYDNINIQLRNGMLGKFYCKINYYKIKNEISVIIYKIKLDDKKGKIYRLYDQNLELCNKYGYFDKIKKIPNKFENIAIITRFNSAAYNDIIGILKECTFMKIYIYDCGMQGTKSVNEIDEAIRVLNKISKKINLDCIIITRGGGSIDDLWIFNDLILLKSIFYSVTPIFTGIGHNIDKSLSDKISDMSFITPTDIGRFIENKNSKKTVENNLKMSLSMTNDKLSYLLDNHIKFIKNMREELDPDLIIDKLNNDNYRLISKKDTIKSYYYNMIKNRKLELDNLKKDIKNLVDKNNKIKLYSLNNKRIIDSNIIEQNKTYKLKINNKIFKIKVL